MFTWVRQTTNRFFSIWMGQLCWWYRCRIKPVNDPANQADHDQLVQRIFFESGIFDSPDTQLAPNRAGSVNKSFYATLKKRPAGAISVIQHPQLLPIQEYFNVELPDDVGQHEIAEITRFVVAKDCRIKPPVVSMGLLNAAVSYARRKKIRWLVCCVPSFFIWGFQVYFNNCRTLEQLPLSEEQVQKRIGRESYFSESRAIRVILVDTESIDMRRGAWEIFRAWRHSFRKRKSGR